MAYHFKSCRKMKRSELIRGAAVFNTHVLDCDNISRLLKIAAPPVYSKGVQYFLIQTVKMFHYNTNRRNFDQENKAKCSSL